jgi:amidase
VEGFPCAGDSAAHQDRRPERDATVVERLRRAGAVVMAKTRPWGGVRHPLDPARSVGGSSSGEAVAVATTASPLGIGSDSGGSIRLPAAWCGVFGFKPTAGRVPTTGHFPRVGALSDGRTQIGPLARNVDDLELALTVIAGPDGRDPGVAPVPLLPSAPVVLRGIRHAVVPGEAEWAPAPDLARAVEHSAGVLDAVGAVRTPWLGPWFVDALDITRRYWRRSELTGAEADRQLRDWDRFRRRYLEASEEVDLLVTPAAIETAPLGREIIGDDFVCTLPASLTGSPAVVVPAGADGAGLPLSVQLVGRPWEDHRVLAAARAVAAGLATDA